ncbi:MAG: extracellular solute-binding protein [Roseiflexaceae bacterium]|nr:extracellular solute-binding protein [Roseiflexaceae bacterium]
MTQEILRIAVRKFGPFESAIQKQYADFQDVTGCPLALEFEALDLNPLYETLFTNGGLRDGTWDIAFIVTDWIAEAVAHDSLADLAALMATHPIPDYPHGWAPALTRFQQFGDAIYGTPYHDGPECFIYRKDLFEHPAEQAAFMAQHGYLLAAPQTWAQFEDIARFFTRPEQNLYGTVFAAYPDGHNTVYDFCLQLWSRGGELTGLDGVITLDTPEAAAALDFYRRMVNDRSVTPPNLHEIDSVKSGELFASGQIAMMVNWFGFAAVCELPDSPTKGLVAVGPLPAGEQANSASLNVYWLLSIGSGSRHREEAYAFLQHTCSRAMDKLTTLEGAIGCRLSTWVDPQVNAAIPFYHRLADLHQTTRELPRSRSLPNLVHVIDNAVQRAITTNDSTAAILREAQQAAAAITL